MKKRLLAKWATRLAQMANNFCCEKSKKLLAKWATRLAQMANKFLCEKEEKKVTSQMGHEDGPNGQ